MANASLTAVTGLEVISAGLQVETGAYNAGNTLTSSTSLGSNETAIFTLHFNNNFTMTAAEPSNGIYLLMSDGQTAFVNGLVSGVITNAMVATLISSLTPGTNTGVTISSFHAPGSAGIASITTIISSAPAKTAIYLTCLVGGTRVATVRGEVAVEDLARGDLVVTAAGEARPVKWIGRTAWEGEMLAAHHYLRPVLVRAGALGDGLPRRDLRVSPLHGVAIDGMLVPAAALVNGVTILRDETDADTTYYHVELDSHDLLLTEGAPTESFLDHEGSRVNFDNAAEYYDLFGEAEAITATPCLPMVREGYALEAIRARLAALAGLRFPGRSTTGFLRSNLEMLANGTLHGWAFDDDHPEDTVEVEVLVDGEVVGRTLANLYRNDLFSAQFGNGCCAFTMELPAAVTSLRDVKARRVSDGAWLVNSADSTVDA